ncbi:DiGeorge syndrome critical region gene 6 (predicted), isoform CRA_c [Rattus norvegicus]|uniref:DiGeorge syndrome critical region gene 6 (Predicted), isoform CRA_c n=1 Tax=Rattus norvegicus TaxID=10116 RepID=A6JSJ1_RAT|nr:DiGeorge syndrome critical region gene 6 (predicted), isoform CRA_c [Rattus norvegicus]
MDRYAGAGDEAADRARQQERHYQLLSALQSLVKELPRCAATGGGRTGAGSGAALTRLSTRWSAHSSFQQRLSYTTLSDLALALLDGTVFEIVQGLLEIQHLTEKSLYNQRLRLQNEHRVLRQTLRQKHLEAQQSCRPHNLPVLQAAQQRELEALEHRIREEQQAMDRKIVLELDRKVADQQSTLEKAGVAGFYVTTNPQELTLQMNLLELIRKLQQRGCQMGKPAL